MLELPIDNYLPEIRQAVCDHPCVIIEAPPGTGKTTRVAPALLQGDAAQKTLLVQPRRLAARTAAQRIASESGNQLGDRIGYQIRFDSRQSASTELLCVTPGILLRKLQSDAVLEHVRCVLLDEFHERSVDYDLILGMLRRIQLELRPDLRIVVMSATLDSESLQDYLQNPPVIRVDANVFPVDIRYANFRSQPSPAGRRSLPRQIVESTAKLTVDAMHESQGDCLVFLPGVGEIQQAARLLETDASKQDWLILQLYGDMRAEDQDQVLQPALQRKLILATNVAETSLTIDGVRVVVDSGYARVQRFDPESGLDALMLEPISMASATQRTGRAGRTATGVCYRSWDRLAERARPAQLDPEIRRVDLVGPVLQLICWGEQEVSQFPWLSPPSAESIEQALQLLDWLGAVRNHKATQLGQQMLRLPVHPRLAKLLVTGHQLGIPQTASLAAAILSERDIIQRHGHPHANPRGPTNYGQQSWDCDVAQRVDALKQFQATGRSECELGTMHHSAARNALRVAAQLERILVDELGSIDASRHAGELEGTELQWSLLSAFPDRLCKRRAAGDARGVMVGGRGVKLAAGSGVTRGDLFLAIHVDGRGSEAQVRMASAIDDAWLPGNLLSEEIHRFFNPTTGSVVSRERTCWHDLVIREQPISTPDDEETAQLLAEQLAKNFNRLLPAKDKQLHAWIDRVNWLNAAMPELQLPSLAPTDLPQLLAPYCYGIKSIAEAKKIPWKPTLMGLLDQHQRTQLEQHAPESYQLPTGRTVLLRYETGKPPVLEARIQEFFGLLDTPKIAGGRIPLLLHLLAPNGRCQQITDDLRSFWENTYPVVRKELRGRYPKHKWPENPCDRE
ncbi:MAG: ATP-dependent helicase HrpB [bacterium]|nr:ATP-dependent helicase HrpB [bacterium]